MSGLYRLRVLMKSGNSFEFECETFKVKGGNDGSGISGIEYEGARVPRPLLPGLKLDQVEAVILLDVPTAGERGQ